jgi:23S rRNA (guanosine2251-2'-O)-methyltransferase
VTPHGGAREFALGGRRTVAEALKAGGVTRLLAARGMHETQGLRAVLDEASRVGVEIEWVSRATLDRFEVPDSQGIVAIVTPPLELDEHALESMAVDADSLIVVLDGITDPQNLGACARSAEAAGAWGLVVRKRRAAPLTAVAVRASSGALLHVPLVRVPNLTRALERLKGVGFFVVGLDHRAGSSIHAEPPPPRPLALVVGAEGEGISRLVREACDVLVSIPMAGRIGSLNASAALAVGLFGFVLRPTG